MKQKVVHVHYHNKAGGLIYTVLSVMTAMIGYQIHHNLFYSIINFIFTPISWIYWLLTDQVTIEIIRKTFPLLFN